MRWLRRFLYSDDPEVKLASGLSEPEAKMWQELLAKNGIRAMVRNMDVLSVAYGASPSNNFDMWVKQSDLERARETLAPMVDSRPSQHRPRHGTRN